jgi:hypothetical protein
MLAPLDVEALHQFAGKDETIGIANALDLKFHKARSLLYKSYNITLLLVQHSFYAGVSAC